MSSSRKRQWLVHGGVLWVLAIVWIALVAQTRDARGLAGLERALANFFGLALLCYAALTTLIIAALRGRAMAVPLAHVGVIVTVFASGAIIGSCRARDATDAADAAAAAAESQ